MTVWVVHPLNNGVDIKDAERFGELRYIQDRYIYNDEIADDGSLPPMFRQALEAAAFDFDAQADYLLIAGDHLQLLAFSALLSTKISERGIYDSFMVLRWVRDANAYMPVRIHT